MTASLLEHRYTSQMLVSASLLNVAILLKCLCVESLGCEISRGRICRASVITKAASLHKSKIVCTRF